jgi:hypothetical protein
MIRHIDGYYVAAQVRLIRQVHKGTVLILEGDTDARAIESFVDGKLCDIEIAFGKTNVLDALDRLEDEAFAGVVGIIDADFDRLRGKSYQVENLCVTDTHDLDLTIFASPAFDRYMAEHADRNLLKGAFGSDLMLVRQKVLDASLPFACCRYTSECRGFYLLFKDLSYDQFVSVEDLSVDSDALLSELISRSRTRCTVPDLKSHFASLLSG